MKILPLISSPTYRVQNNKLSQCKPKPSLHTQPNFKGALSSQEMDRIINKLSKKNTEVIERLLINKELINNVARELTHKHKTNNVGMQIITDEFLAKFLGKKPYETQHQVGLCIAVGDKRGPIENWNKIYEAKTILIDKGILLESGMN
jgi:hypothetical protein